MERDPLLGKIPVTIITGFLGSGKTTLISRLVSHPDMNRVAVVINEVGEIGIDHDLVSMSSESVSLLSNGCICCSVRTDLQETLRVLFNDRRSGLIPDFDRVIMETTGLADPAPVIQTLVTDPLLSAHFRYDGLVTVVDGLLGERTAHEQSESIKQIAMADLLIISKADIALEPDFLSLRQYLARINPHADQKPIRQGFVEPRTLMNLGLSSRNGLQAESRLFGDIFSSAASTAGETPGPGKYLGERVASHPSGFQTFSLRFSEPFTWDSISAALECLVTLRGSDLLRTKGIVNIEGKPVVVQGVQHIFSPPVWLDRWPSDDRDSRIVFIARRLDNRAIAGLFKSALQLSDAPELGSDKGI
jgi:G3E family GTPase